MLKQTLTAGALAALLATPAFAQQPASSTNKQMQSVRQGATSKPNQTGTNRSNMAEKGASARPAGFSSTTKPPANGAAAS